MGPRINDDYWFAYSETLAKSAHDARDQAADKIQNLVLWLWAIYTTFASVGFVLSKKGLNWWCALLIGVASASLIAVYWGTVWVRIPLLVQFDPRSPTEIMQAYGRAVEARSRRLNITLLLSIIAAALVSVALLVASVTDEPVQVTPSLAVASSGAGDQRRVSATAFVGNVKEVKFSVLNESEQSATGREPDSYLPSANGHVYVSTQIPSTLKEAVVAVEWVDSTGLTNRLSRKISIK